MSLVERERERGLAYLAKPAATGTDFRREENLRIQEWTEEITVVLPLSLSYKIS